MVDIEMLFFHYFESFSKEYPDVWSDTHCPISFMKQLHLQINAHSNELKPQNDRFCSIMSRGFSMDQNAWELSKRGVGIS